jgi:CheY-specific phosphatase CheX
MEPNLLEAFSASFRDVLVETGLLGAAIERDSAPVPGPADLLCSVGITGGLRGYLILSFRNPELAALTKAMTSKVGMDFRDGDSSTMKEAASEIANQLAGRAANSLARRGIDCMITPPTLVTGSSLSASIPNLDRQEAWTARFSGREFGIRLHSVK